LYHRIRLQFKVVELLILPTQLLLRKMNTGRKPMLAKMILLVIVLENRENRL
jgi:hypothetical protein